MCSSRKPDARCGLANAQTGQALPGQTWGSSTLARCMQRYSFSAPLLWQSAPSPPYPVCDSQAQFKLHPAGEESLKKKTTPSLLPLAHTQPCCPSHHLPIRVLLGPVAVSLLPCPLRAPFLAPFAWTGPRFPPATRSTVALTSLDSPACAFAETRAPCLPTLPGSPNPNPGFPIQKSKAALCALHCCSPLTKLALSPRQSFGFALAASPGAHCLDDLSLGLHHRLILQPQDGSGRSHPSVRLFVFDSVDIDARPIPNHLPPA